MKYRLLDWQKKEFGNLISVSRNCDGHYYYLLFDISQTKWSLHPKAFFFFQVTEVDIKKTLFIKKIYKVPSAHL